VRVEVDPPAQAASLHASEAVGELSLVPELGSAARPADFFAWACSLRSEHR
jgi:hypothetical protein